MNSKMTTNSQLSTTEHKKNKELSKQLEQEQNHRNGDHMEDYQWGGRGGEWGEMVQGIKSINGRHKIDRGRLRIVPVSYTHLTLPTIPFECRSRWSPYH